MKGVSSIHVEEQEAFSHPRNDFDGLRDVEDFLYDNTVEESDKDRQAVQPP